jgi:SAM-dependent methyltransferase
MRHPAMAWLRDPKTQAPLQLASETNDALVSPAGARYPIRGGIARFVADEAYTASFGEQWRRYRLTQIDRENGTRITADRLYETSGWRPSDLAGQHVLEVGCGAGRFTQVLLDAGAFVTAVDYSSAVEACLENNRDRSELLVVQADLFALPLAEKTFDRVLCYGVLQHTPDPARAFRALLPFLRPGGHLAVDCYRKTPWTNRWTAKYWWRPLTRRLPPNVLRRVVEAYVPRWLPIDTAVQRIPILWRLIPAIVPCYNYTGMLPLTREQVVSWAVLDTFDGLAPRFDLPQTLETVRSWFDEARLEDIQVRPGGTGIVGTARRPASADGGAR